MSNQIKKGLIELICVAIPKVFGGASMIAINLILLRKFSPEQFGMYSLCLTGIILTDAMFGSAVDLGVMRLAPLYRDTDFKKSLSIEKIAIAFKFIAIFLISIFIFFIRKDLSTFIFHTQNTSNLLIISCFAATSMLLTRSALAHLQLEGNFKLYGMLDFLQQIIKYGGIILVLLFFNIKPDTALLFFVLGPMVSFIFFLKIFGKKIISLGSIQLKAVKEFLNFVKWFLLTFSITGVMSKIDIFLLTAWSVIGNVGLLAGALTLTSIIELMGTYISIVFSPKIMPYCRDGRFFSIFWKFQLLCIISCIIIYTVLLTNMQLISDHIIPGSFNGSIELIVILLPGAFMSMATFPITISFLMFAKPKFIVSLECITVPIVIALYYFGIKNYGAVGAAWVTSTTRFTKSAILQLTALKLAKSIPKTFGNTLKTTCTA